MSRQPRYADLHCHPHGKAFNFLRNTSQRNSPRYHPWTVILSNWEHQRKGRRAFSYAQCDPVKLWNGGGAVLFASLYPFEKGFFRGGGKVDGLLLRRLLHWADRLPLLGSAAQVQLRMLLQRLVSSEEGISSAKDYLQSLLMRMPLERVEFIQSAAYDYFKELEEEYRFLLSRSGLTTKAEVYGTWLQRLRWRLFPHRNARDSTQATGTYVVAKNAQDVHQALQRGHLAFVVTIEGMHALGTDTHLPELMRRIEAIKQWSPPVFFITFAHHFDNQLCGHAHSFPQEGTLFANQRQNMQAPFSEIGWAALRYLLSLDNQNRKNEAALGRRIFIDIKHMGATARRQYYDQIVRPALHQQPPDVIPVIASHVGYSGVKTLKEQEENFRRSGEPDDYQVIPGLNAWNINVCDEDVELIIKTGGLLGLCLDQRILGQKKKEQRSGIELVWHNISRLVEGVKNHPNLSQAEKHRIWDCLCIGSDFEGYIDPADDFATALAFEQLEQELVHRIRAVEVQGLAASLLLTDAAEVVVRKICLENVLRFLQRNFI
ncbi:MAG: hypothetical protein RMK52_03085 [Chitinophagales bacterium]|nr:dipeptidase [Chitinophagales bacterium]MDW8393209.1 hypothetical protein [Chitinophagales bacterium]